VIYGKILLHQTAAHLNNTLSEHMYSLNQPNWNI